MKLYSLDCKLAVTQTHDDASTIAVVAGGGDFQVGRQAPFLDNERVIAGSGQGRGNTTKNRPAVVLHGAGLAVHEVRGANHLASERRSDCLVPEAHTEDGNTAGEVFNEVDADAGLLGSARAGRDNDSFGTEPLDFFEGRLIVTANHNLVAQFSDVLHQVVGERVVVIKSKDHFQSLAVRWLAVICFRLWGEAPFQILATPSRCLRLSPVTPSSSRTQLQYEFLPMRSDLVLGHILLETDAALLAVDWFAFSPAGH